ncbi:hypothetical protein AAVH_28971 [Aphelenchoides avenae]|nr:hypothetical protein AAVH_28971 [Aphelenchus avenae]
MQLPSESLRDGLLFLDRFDLDAVEITSRKFRAVIPNLKDLPLRRIRTVLVNKDSYLFSVASRKIKLGLHEISRFFAGLRLSRVEWFQIQNVLLSNDFLRDLKEVVPHVRAVAVAFSEVDFQVVQQTLFRDVLLSFASISSMVVDTCFLKRYLITDALVTSVAARGLQEFKVVNLVGPTKQLDVTDSGILKFCMRRPGGPTSKFLQLDAIRISDEFIANFVKACQDEILVDELELHLESMDEHQQFSLGQYHAMTRWHDRYNATLTIAERGLVFKIGPRYVGIERKKT